MIRILVVEDDDVVATLLEHVFRREGHEVQHVAEGREVTRLLRDDPPDVVVLDYMLPHMSGLEILKEIRHSDGWKEVPVIFLSARTSSRDITEVLEAGANDYMTKPFAVDELGARVRRLVRS
ncbi:MAG: response regulator transcription factor [Candidatus Binatia bacterium]